MKKATLKDEVELLEIEMVQVMRSELKRIGATGLVPGKDGETVQGPIYPPKETIGLLDGVAKYLADKRKGPEATKWGAALQGETE